MAAAACEYLQLAYGYDHQGEIRMMLDTFWQRRALRENVGINAHTHIQTDIVCTYYLRVVPDPDCSETLLHRGIVRHDREHNHQAPRTRAAPRTRCADHLASFSGGKARLAKPWRRFSRRKFLNGMVASRIDFFRPVNVGWINVTSIDEAVRHSRCCFSIWVSC